MGALMRALREYGIKGTLRKLYQMRVIKFGQLVGVDKYGNKYYENTVDYPLNQHRWVEYAGDKSVYEVDASNIPPEWHGWLHSSTTEPPTDKTVGSSHRFAPQANAHGSSAPYKRSLGGVVSAFTPNLSQFRPRGYGVGNGLTGGSKPGEELYYTQPGWPLDKRNGSYRVRRDLGFTIADSVPTLRAKEAARLGVTAEAYERKLLEGTGVPTPDEAARMRFDAAVEGALAGKAPHEVDAASYAAAMDAGFKAAESGTFEAAVSAALTPEEEAFLDEGHDEDALLTTIGRYQRIADEYAGVPNKTAAEGAAKAKEIVADASAKLAKLRAITAKLEALEAEFDARAVAAAASASAAAAGAAAGGAGAAGRPLA